MALFCLAPLGPAAGLTGYYWLAVFPEAVAGVMLFAAGGILYLTFQDIAPHAPRHAVQRHAPAFGAAAGFLCGVMGQVIVPSA